MPVQPIPRKQMVEEVMAGLRRMIEQSGLRPGDRLDGEYALAEKFAVSRNVVREAVGRLVALGLVEVRHGLGTFVGTRDSLSACAKLACSAVTIDASDWQAIAELRIAIECQAARRAAERATPDQLTQLETALDKLAREGQSVEEVTRADWAFHRKIIEIGGGPVMLNVIAIVQEFLIEKIQLNTKAPVDHRRQRRIHQRIVDSIRSGDPDLAEKTVRHHVESFAQRIAKLGAQCENRPT